jgi:hypothetical protein
MVIMSASPLENKRSNRSKLSKKTKNGYRKIMVRGNVLWWSEHISKVFFL